MRGRQQNSSGDCKGRATRSSSRNDADADIHVIVPIKIPIPGRAASLGFDGHNVCHHTVWDLVALLGPCLSTLGFEHLAGVYWPIPMFTLLRLHEPYTDHQGVPCWRKH